MSDHSNILYSKKNKTVPLAVIGFEAGEARFMDRQLTVEDGVITKTAPAEGAPELFVTAGFINCHVHWLMDRAETPMDERAAFTAGDPGTVARQAIEQARQTLKLGVTFACDKAPIGINGVPVYREILRAAEAGEPMTNTLFSPWALMCEGGFGDPFGRTISSNVSMKLTLKEMDAVGATAIKFIPETPYMKEPPHYRFVFPRESFSIARQHAREKNWVFAVHAKGTQTLDVCIQESVDCIEHGILATDEQLRSFQEKNIFLGYTFDGLLCRLEYAQKIGQGVEETGFEWKAVNDLAARAAKLNDGRPFTQMLFSSDAGSYKTPHASIRELYLMRKAGIPAATVLEAATVNGAKCLKQPTRGSVEKGKRADLILWKSNPLELTINQWQNLEDHIEAVVLNGVVV